MTQITPNSIVQKSFVVGRPIHCAVRRYDRVTLNITLTDTRNNVIDLTDCVVTVSTSDTETHIWEATILNAAGGQFQFTFEPRQIGRVFVSAIVDKYNSGAYTSSTTFFLGCLAVAYETDDVPEHMKSLTETVRELIDETEEAKDDAIAATTAANTATSNANSAATSATNAATTANTAATSADNSASGANSAATRANNAAAAIEAASIDVGTVTSGATPAISKRGTPLNPIFDFVLAKGDKGEKGDKGDPGEITQTQFETHTNNTNIHTTAAEKTAWNTKQAALTTEQLAATNSGVTSPKVSSYDSHVANTANPHSVTKAQIGLGNCDNTADVDKPISTATQTALNTKANSATTLAGYGITDAVNFSLINANNGIAGLDGNSKIATQKLYTNSANNVAGLDSNAKVPYANLPVVGAIASGNIIEQGSNDNGKYTKFADGSMICFIVRTVTVPTMNAYGNLYQTGATLTLPAIFSGTPAACAGCYLTNQAPFCCVRIPAASTIRVTFYDVYQRQEDTFSVYAIAVGRWQ